MAKQYRKWTVLLLLTLKTELFVNNADQAHFMQLP